MNNLPLYTLIFEDDEKFIGGTDYRDTKWLSIPCNQKIRRIFYRLPTNDYLTLGNFSQIYHYVEAVLDLNGKNRGKTNIEFVCLLLERGDKVLQYKINQATGNINMEIFDKDDDYIQKLNISGWKLGITN